MRSRRMIAVSAVGAAGMLGLVAMPAGAVTAAHAKLVNDLHHVAPSTKADSTTKLVALGVATCSILKFGSVSAEVGVLSEASNTFHFPKKQVVPIVATIVKDLCPSHTSAVKTYQAAHAKGSSSAPPKVAAAPTTTAPTAPPMTQQQKSAQEAAKQYLQTDAFSQQGLIDQLDSSAGDGYSQADATIAVDSLTVDWNAEAVQSAKEYMKEEPFSCQDLIDQLDSSAGEEFTVAQATYGAQQAGDCG